MDTAVSNRKYASLGSTNAILLRLLSVKTGCGAMDKILSELKSIREEVEGRFVALLEELEEESERLSREREEMLRKIGKLAQTDFDREVVDQLRSAHEGFLGKTRRLVTGLRELMSLHNARSAELARQLTVLPLERMDLLLDRFERRLEVQECELQRLQKKLEVSGSGSRGKNQ